jgi:signal transduction histidine kinase
MEGNSKDMSSPAVAVESAIAGSSQDAPQMGDAICRLVHDLRQPLSTIEAIAYYLEITLPADQLEARRYLTRLRQTVEESNSILLNAIRESQPQNPV